MKQVSGLHDIGGFHQKQYDADTRWVAEVARSIRLNHPDVPHNDCIRIAERALKERK